VNKIVSGIILILFLVYSLSLVFHIQPAKGEPRTWIVDDNGPADFHTIQEAINAANQGDTIYVYNGTYYEHVLIDKAISLLGENKSTTIIDGGGTSTVVSIQSPEQNVLVDGFTIQYGFDGVELTAFGGSKVSNNIIRNNTNDGIYLFYSSDNIISGNTITNNTEVGIHVGYWLDYPSNNNTITENTISCDDYGMVLDTSEGNTIFNNTLTAYHHEQGIRLYYSSNNHILGNRMTGTPLLGVDINIGILLEESNYNNIAENNMTFVASSGVELQYSSNHNNVTDNNFIGGGGGITIYASSNNKINRNSMENGWVSIDLEYSSGNMLMKNNVKDSVWYGIFIYKAIDNTIFHNNFIDNFYQANNEDGVSANAWDNGVEGNYWSDFVGEDIDHDGISDISYVIDANNQDYYPLMSPFIEGDANHDGIVNVMDASLAGISWLSQHGEENYNPHVDFNIDGIINIEDATTIGVNWLRKWEDP
jgi:parallel beta-helix repeat protein